LLDSLPQERFLPALRRRGQTLSRSGGHIGFVGYTLVWSNPILANHTYTEGCTHPEKHVDCSSLPHQLPAGKVFYSEEWYSIPYIQLSWI